MKRDQIKTVIFDLGGVILNIDPPKTARILQSYDHSVSISFIYEELKKKQVFERFETGEISPKEFRDHVNAYFNTKLSDEQIDFAWNAMLLDYPTERLELIKSLRKEFKIYLLSNTNEIHVAAFEKIASSAHAGLQLVDLFDKVYYSNEIGMRKPNAEIFQYVLNQNNLQAESTLFLDDYPHNTKAANELGINTVTIQDTNIIEVFENLK